jgi:hypothetical protein
MSPADFFFPEFNMVTRSEEGAGADLLLLLREGLTVGILAITEGGGARGAIDKTRGVEELVMEAEGATTGLDVSFV